MKYFKILFVVFLLTVCVIQISMTCAASELVPIEGYTDNPDGYPDNTQPASSPVTDESMPASSAANSEDQPASSPAISEDQPASSTVNDDSESVRAVSDPIIVTTLAPMTPSNTNGFQAVVLGLLGNYNPVVLEYAYTNSNGFTSYVREVQPDYSWMCSAAVFAIVLYSLFRLVGGLIKR